MSLRPICADDVGGVHGLMAQLGYDIEKDEIAGRIARIDDRRLVLVASIDSAVIGFVSVAVDEAFVEGWTAHIEGFVVDASVRGFGIGARMLHAAEAWAAQRSCTKIGVHSNVVRRRAHRFYQRHGYGLVKSQRFFVKVLS